MDIATAAGAAAAAAARDPGREEEVSLLIKEEREEESRPEVQAAVIVKCEEQEESVGSEVGGVAAGNEVEVSVDSRGERDASSQGWAEVEVELEDSDGDDGGGVGGGRSKRQQHPCLDCGKTFVSIGGLRRHAQLHGIKRPCRERGRILTSDRDRRTRCQSHRQPRRPKSPTADGGRACPGRASAESRRHLCGVCGRGFPWLCYLRSHERRHVLSGPRRRAVCAECGEVFSGQRELARHRQGHARGPLGQSASAQPGEGAGGGGAAAAEGTPATTLFLCDACDRAFPSHGELVEHRASHDGGGRGERGSTLPSASKLSRRRKIRSGELCRPHPRRHRRAGERASERGRAFRRPSGLRRHRGRRPNARPDAPGAATEPTDAAGDGRGRDDGAGGAHVCGECGRGFRWPSYLKRHGRTHTGERPHVGAHVCAECGQGFRWLSYLTRHRRTHTGDRPHTCAECGKGFSQPSDLRRHRRLHATERPGAAPAAASEGAVSRPTVLEESEPPPPPLPPPTPDGDDCRRQGPRDASRELVCTECGQAFACASSLNRHRRAHLGVRPHARAHVCDDCGQEFRWLSYLKRHRRTHTGERQNVCGECGKAFYQPSDLTKHRRTHGTARPHVCGRCGRGFATPEKLAAHRGVHAGERPHVCPECGKTFAFADNLRKHAKIHARDKPPPCELCGRGFETFYRLSRHRKVHSGEYPHVCDECGEGFPCASHLRKHQWAHGGQKAYACGDCSKAFARASELKRHRRKHARTHSSERPYACEVCGKGFVSSSRLRTHREIHSGERPYPCAVCGKRFAQPHGLGCHLKLHSGVRPHVCKECGEAFFWLSALKRHQMKHTGERPHVCQECGKGFTLVYRLKKHQKIHAAKLYLCDECGKGFTWHSSLRVHKRVHSREKPYVCEECGVRFAEPSNLKTHLRTHTGDRPYACEECGRRFSQSAVRRHRLTHSGERPYACGECGRTFPRTCSLRKHRRTHAGQRSHGCRECRRKFPNVAALRKHQKTFRCEECGRGFDGRHGLQVHRYKHAREAQGNPGEEPVSGCAQTPPKAELRENYPASQCRCEECGKEFESSRALNVHRFKHTRDSERRLVQEPTVGCPKSSPRESQQERPETSLHRCEECGKGFATSHAKNIHRFKHKREAQSQLAEQPSANHRDVPRLQPREGDLDEKTLHECEECGKGFATSRARNIHRFKHTRDSQKQLVQEPTADYRNVPQPESQERPETGQFRCEECGKGFATSHAKNVHRFMHRREAESQLAERLSSNHSEISQPKALENLQEESRHRCDECGKEFDGVRDLQVHRYSHAKEAQKRVADGQISNRPGSSSRPDTQQSWHESQHVCKECGEEFDFVRDLQVHIYKHARERQILLNERPISKHVERAQEGLHRCEECGKGFATSHAKNIHRFKHKREAQSQLAEQPPANHRDVPRLQPRAGDLDEKTLHECEECGKGFATSRAMNIHRFMHTRDSQKQLVQEPTANYQNVPQHESQERPELSQYRCEECGKGFNSSRGLQVHRFKHTREGEGQLVQQPIFIHLESSSEPEEQSSEQGSQYVEYAQELNMIQGPGVHLYKQEREAYHKLGERPISKGSKRSPSDVQETAETSLHHCEECGKGFATSHAKNIHRFKHKREAQNQLAEQPPANHRDVPRLQPREGDLDEKTLHECEECGKGFATSRAMNIHRFKHTRDSQKQLVQEPTANYQNVPQPESQERPELSQYRCEKCGKGFNSSRGLQVHRFKHTREGEGQLVQQPIFIHLESSSEPEEQKSERGSQYVEYAQEFVNIQSQYKHEREAYRNLSEKPISKDSQRSLSEVQQIPEKRLYRCEECGKEFGTRKGHEVHRLKHTKDAQGHRVELPISSRPEPSPSKAQKNPEQNRHQCGECGKEFGTFRGLSIHFSSHSMEAQNRLPQKQAAAGAEDSLPLAQKSLEKIQHGCEECGKAFDSYRGLQVHYFKHIREAEDQLNEESMSKRHKAATQPEVMEVVDQESQHRCEECGKEFGNYLGLQIHRSKHAKEVQRHLHQRTLAEHFESWQANAQDDARMGDRKECGKEFDTVRDLQVHPYNHAHGPITQHRLQSGAPLGLHAANPVAMLYACKKCGIVFPNEQGLQLHQKKHVADAEAASGHRTGD
ncbi:unnamed protein product [Lampetra fluviatilis]